MSKNKNRGKPHGHSQSGASSGQHSHGHSQPVRQDASDAVRQSPRREQTPPGGQGTTDRTARQTLAQLRAKHALAQIEAMKAEDDGHLSAHIAGFPAMILMSGFGQACAFYLSKGGTRKVAYDALEKWLVSPGRPYSGANDGLMKAIVDNNAAKYRLAQAEALAYLDWLKKFAKAFLKSEEGKKEGENHEDAAI